MGGPGLDIWKNSRGGRGLNEKRESELLKKKKHRNCRFCEGVGLE